MTDKIAKQLSETLASVLYGVFSSPNVSDSNFENANIVDALDSLGARVLRAAKHLGNGDAETKFGALESLGMQINSSTECICESIDNLAGDIRDLTQLIEQRLQN